MMENKITGMARKKLQYERRILKTTISNLSDYDELGGEKTELNQIQCVIIDLEVKVRSIDRQLKEVI